MATRYFFWTVILLFLSQNCVPEQEGALKSRNDINKSEVTELGEVDFDRPVHFKLERLDVELEMSRGEIVKAENPTWEGYCLNENKLALMLDLLNDYGICQTDHDYPENTFCTLQYQFPFLSLFLVDGEDRVDLGEKTSGCPAHSIHLCEQNDQLEPLLRNLSFANDFAQCSF